MFKTNPNFIKNKNLMDSRNSMYPKQKRYKETTVRCIIVKLLKTRTVQYAKGSFLYIHKIYLTLCIYICLIIQLKILSAKRKEIKIRPEINEVEKQTVKYTKSKLGFYKSNKIDKSLVRLIRLKKANYEN